MCLQLCDPDKFCLDTYADVAEWSGSVPYHVTPPPPAVTITAKTPDETAGSAVPPKPKAPEKLVYSQIDISPFINRSFDDEISDDGKGGWLDLGQGMDLGEMPTGMQTLNGVPFQILPQGGIVLKSKVKPAGTDLPDRVVIPVRKKANVLVFLHAADMPSRNICGHMLSIVRTARRRK